MKTIQFTNPPKSLFYQLEKLGLIKLYHEDDKATEQLKGVPIYNLKLPGISENACWGNYKEFIKNNESNIKNHLIKKGDDYIFNSATINLSDKGLEILESSNIKNWKIL